MSSAASTPHPRQLFLEEAVSLLGYIPDGLMPIGARCGARSFVFLVLVRREGRGGVSWYVNPRSLPSTPLLPTPALLLAVILVHSSLGKTEPLYTPTSTLNAEAPFPPAFTETS